MSKISALGQNIFRSKDAVITKLFEDLILSAAKVKAETNNETKTTVEDKTVS